MKYKPIDMPTAIIKIREVLEIPNRTLTNTDDINLDSALRLTLIEGILKQVNQWIKENKQQSNRGNVLD